ncbi:hypothetical protein IG612_04200 [Pectobacterium sp. FL60-S17]|uniref:hypothetical protein n=2 Tax=Pectobacterium quasiaquaticum TaxID=2774015 RepID=UPI001875A2DF|nr:hypothetical protein [Pectobacterium quasiaquaticum]MBE5201829.1 hypothetical protein [Pectobacterium quasiaquaticum]MBE5210144.1 hypothetical protein [Pectobacterium quasiaquaticum]
MKIISISRMGGGLNNQKMMLLGLLITAIESNAAIQIPPLINYVTNKKDNIFKKYIYGKLIYPLFHRYIPFFDMFDHASFIYFTNKYNIIISKEKADIEYKNEEMFKKGSNIIDEYVNNENYNYKSLISDFFKFLIPSKYMKEKIDFFIDQSQPIDAVCQLRIEDDWPLDVNASWQEKQGSTKLPSQLTRSMVIFEKIYNTLPSLKYIYVAYDKNGLKIPFTSISDTVDEKFGFKLKTKHPSVLKRSNPKNALEASIIDFEISVSVDIYIGTEMSSFTLLSNITKENRDGHPLQQRYHYNTKRDYLTIYANKTYQ